MPIPLLMAHLFDAGDAAELVVNVGISIERDGEARPTDEKLVRGGLHDYHGPIVSYKCFGGPGVALRQRVRFAFDVVTTPNHPAAIFEAD